MSPNELPPVRRLSPTGAHYFFGYYDIPAADSAGRHLCHKVLFRDRLPIAGDVATLGWLSLPDGTDDAAEPVFQAFGETLAWNFQQGAMLQWIASSPDTCLYNVFENGEFGSCLHNVRTGAQRRLPLPVANVSRDGSQALCINMARLYDFRPGYGYEERPDPFAGEAAPAQDGVWLMDLATGSARLILSLARIVAFLEEQGERLGDAKVVINHITFNPSASRFLLLLRIFPSPNQRWRTFLVTADSDGGELRNHPVWDYASHYHWRDDDGMLFYARVGEDRQSQLALFSDRQDTRQIIDAAYFREDGHCSYSPDGQWILYDSYPGAPPENFRQLQVYSLARRQGYSLGQFSSDPKSTEGGAWDIRCDLHPHWMPDGHSLTFDSVHEGERAIYGMDIGKIIAGS